MKALEKFTNLKAFDTDARTRHYLRPVRILRTEGTILNADDLLMDKDGHLTLTGTGLEIAQKIYDRHTLLSRVLMKLGVSEDVATADACKLEHAISDESYEAIKSYLNKIETA